MNADGVILPRPLLEAGGTATSTLIGEGLEEVGVAKVLWAFLALVDITHSTLGTH